MPSSYEITTFITLGVAVFLLVIAIIFGIALFGPSKKKDKPETKKQPKQQAEKKNKRPRSKKDSKNIPAHEPAPAPLADIPEGEEAILPKELPVKTAGDTKEKKRGLFSSKKKNSASSEGTDDDFSEFIDKEAANSFLKERREADKKSEGAKKFKRISTSGGGILDEVAADKHEAEQKDNSPLLIEDDRSYDYEEDDEIINAVASFTSKSSEEVAKDGNGTIDLNDEIRNSATYMFLTPDEESGNEEEEYDPKAGLFGRKADREGIYIPKASASSIEDLMPSVPASMIGEVPVAVSNPPATAVLQTVAPLPQATPPEQKQKVKLEDLSVEETNPIKYQAVMARYNKAVAVARKIKAESQKSKN